MRKLTLGLMVVAAVVYLFLYCRNGLGALLLFAPFTIGPLAFIAYFVTRWNYFGSQLTCLVGTILYLAWCVYIYVDVTILHPDPQSPIALLFIGVYAAPVLFVLFLIAYAFEWHSQAGRKVGDFAS